MNGKQCKGLLATGATRTLITEDIVSASRPNPTTPRAYDGTAVATLRVADVVVKARDKTCWCTCFVVPVGNMLLFGQDVIRQLELLSQTEVNLVRIKPI